MNAISKYLTLVHRDWENSRNAFPNNTYPPSQWPIPFFGNPANALVATVGVNPSSEEFDEARDWASVHRGTDWQVRLRDYFKLKIPAHEWFEPWRIGLELLGVSYEAGTAAHFDVSYRTTTAMLTNPTTDREEFRAMVEKDVAWFFKLLPLCPELRGLLAYGPVVRHDGFTESLTGFVRKSAPRHGFSVMPDGGLCRESEDQLARNFFLHEVASRGAGTVTERVVANLTLHRQILRRKIHSAP